MISNFDADLRGSQNFLTQIHSFVQEQLHMSHGIYRFKDEGAPKAFHDEHHPRQFEEPSAEYPDGRFI